MRGCVIMADRSGLPGWRVFSWPDYARADQGLGGVEDRVAERAGGPAEVADGLGRGDVVLDASISAPSFASLLNGAATRTIHGGSGRVAIL